MPTLCQFDEKCHYEIGMPHLYPSDEKSLCVLAGNGYLQNVEKELEETNVGKEDEEKNALPHVMEELATSVCVEMFNF